MSYLNLSVNRFLKLFVLLSAVLSVQAFAAETKHPGAMMMQSQNQKAIFF